MSVFEMAARHKFRFPSSRGELTAEQLFDLPLTSKGGFCLDAVARAVNTELKSVTEESFVEIKPDPRKPELEAKLELVKFVIADRIKANEAVRAAAERAEKRRLLLDALATKEREELSQASRDDILKQLAELDA